MSGECGRHSNNSTHSNSNSNSLPCNNRQHTALGDSTKEEKDDVSEAGTYTIDKDSSSPEVEQARSDIDKVFGVSGTESELEGGGGATLLTPRGLPPVAPPPPDDPWTEANALEDKFKSPSSLSRNSPNWIHQWAAQVAQHSKAAHPPTRPRTNTPSTATGPSPSPSQDSSDPRPRRKLPTPPTHPLSQQQRVGVVETSDSECATKGRSRTHPPTRGANPHTASFESHDSGGDSDVDTSTSYPRTDHDHRLTRQLKARLRLVGIEGGTKTPPSASPRRPATSGGDGLGKVFRRERSIVSDGGYDGFVLRAEEGSGQSDSSSDASDHGGGTKDVRKAENNPPLKFNRAFSLRRARLGCEESSPLQQTPKPPSPMDKKKTVRPSSAGSLPSNSRKLPLGHTKSQSIGGLRSGPSSVSGQVSGHTQGSGNAKTGGNDFTRGDGGRFSLRLPRSGSTSAVSKSPSRASTRKEGTASGSLAGGTRRGGGAPRSNSTLSAKEVDFQNWKRRKNYDPMKAAAEGRKKNNDKRGDKSNPSGTTSTVERSPSPPGSLLRSASFHGTEGMGGTGGSRWPRPRTSHLYPSEDEGPFSLEENPHPVPHCSPLRRSPTSPQQLCSPHNTSPAHQPPQASRGRRASYTHSDEGGEGAQVLSPTRKASMDESGSEGKRSPISSTRGLVSSRSKAKMEALDNLVISTIHSLSVKVRTTSETLLMKLKSQYDEEGDRAALLEEVLAHLSESDPSLGGGSGGGRSTSRELAGILRNLKKIEHALEVIERVMICPDDDDDDDDDDDRGGILGGQEWGESDY